MLAGSQSGILPDSSIYLFNSRDNWEQSERVNILKFILKNDIKLDVLCMASFFQDNPETNALIQKLKERGITFVDSSIFWQDFSYGRNRDNSTSLDQQLQYMYDNREHLNGKRRELLDNIPNTIIIPCAGRSHSQIGGGYMYNGVGCASWSIPQVAGLYCIAKQIDKNISYDDFLKHAKESATKGEIGLNLDLLAMTKRIEETVLKRQKNSDDYYDNR